MNLGNVYWDWSAMQADHRMPSILAIGDSWFWYPLPGGSLLNQLGPLVARREHNILALGNNGAEVFDYVRGKYETLVQSTLAMHGSALSAVFISGGGNDFAGFTQLAPMLFPDCTSASTAEECFCPDDRNGTLPWLMRKTGENYRVLLEWIFGSCDPRIKVFVHDYDYAIPSGKGVLKGGSCWLKPALDACRVPEELQAKCMRHLIGKFSEMQNQLASDYPGQVVVVDSKGTLDEGDWANELHPNPKGFRKIALRCWKPMLTAHGLA